MKIKNILLNRSPLFMMILLLISLFLRIEGLINETFAYTYDVGRDLLKVKEIVSSFDIVLIGQTTGIPGLFYGPWWYYILTVPFVLSGGDPKVLLLFIIATGVASIYLSYLLGETLHSKVLGLLYASLFVVSPVLIGLASQIWNPNIIPFLVLLFLLIFLRLITVPLVRKKSVHFIYLGLFAGLILDSEIVYGGLFIIGFIVSSIFFRKIYSVKRTLFVLLGFLIIQTPRILFELKHEFIMSKAVFQFLQNGRDGGGAGFYFQPVNSFLSHWKIFTDSVSHGSTIFGVILIAVIIFSFYAGRNLKDKNILLLRKIFLIYIITSFLVLSFYFESIYEHYLVGMPVFYIGMLAISFCIFYIVYKKYKHFIVILFLLVIVINLNPVNRILGYAPPASLKDPAQYAVHKQVVDFIYKDADGQPFKYILYTPPVHDFTYSYLFQWYGQKKYGYKPQNENVSNFYVIIEPDREYPERITDWLEQREDDGKVISDELLPSKIRIQKRMIQN